MARQPISLDHIPDEHLRGIGLVALSWSYLEGAIERIIWRLARVPDKRGLAMTTHMNVPTRLDTMCALADATFPDAPQTQQLPKIAKHIRKNLSTKRNTIVHSRVIQFGYIEFAFRVSYKARGKVKKSAEPIDLAEYEIAAKEILETASKLRSILADYYQLIIEKDGAPPP